MSREQSPVPDKNERVKRKLTKRQAKLWAYPRRVFRKRKKHGRQ